MGSNNECCFVGPRLSDEQTKYLIRPPIVEAPCRFVGKDELGLIDHRTSDTDALFLPLTQFIWIGALLIGNVEGFEYVVHAGRMLWKPRHVLCKQEIVADGKRREQVHLLKDHTYRPPPKLIERMARQPGEIASGDCDAALRRTKHAGHHVKQGRLTTAGWAQNEPVIALAGSKGGQIQHNLPIVSAANAA